MATGTPAADVEFVEFTLADRKPGIYTVDLEPSRDREGV
jgi:hypothetical protein